MHIAKIRTVINIPMSHYNIITNVKGWCASRAHFLIEKSIVLPQWKDYTS